MEMICVAKCTAIHKESKAQGFSTLKVGDVVYFSAELAATGRSNNGTYAAYVCIENERTSEIGYKSFNELGRLLSNYEFKQLNETKSI